MVGPLFTNEMKLTVTWAEFEATFDCQFHSESMKAIRLEELYSLEEGSISIVNFEQKFRHCQLLFPGYSSLRSRSPDVLGEVPP